MVKIRIVEKALKILRQVQMAMMAPLPVILSSTSVTAAATNVAKIEIYKLASGLTE